VKRLGGFSIMETDTQFHVENDLEPKCLKIWELGCTTTPHIVTKNAIWLSKKYNMVREVLTRYFLGIKILLKFMA
jgi:hypothetical protein